MQDAFAEQVEVRPAIHTAFHHFEPLYLPFDLTGTAAEAQRYRDVLRRRLARARDPAFFLSARGTRIRLTRLTERLHSYVVAAGVGKPGSVHILRHMMATLMHDAGSTSGTSRRSWGTRAHDDIRTSRSSA